MISVVLRRVLPMVILMSAACAGAQSPAPAPSSSAPAGAPNLVVLIVVDQLRGDMLDRYQADLSRGYARLMKGGAWFTNGFQDHAITETAPGHASTLSGRFPANTGIVENAAGVWDAAYPLLAGLRNEPGASPHRFVGTTLVDWLTTADRRSRAFSVSLKDRGAILPIGKSKQQVYWYSASGVFTTSSFYRDTLPSWVVAFNERRIPQSYAGAAWKLSRPASSYAEPDSVHLEGNGYDYVFPHMFPADAEGAASYIRTTPTMDSLTAIFALEGLERLGLGRGPQTDVMSVSFSATDYIGHKFGPDSREARENAIRLDGTIGMFLDSLFALRDPSTVMIALTADHGVAPIPELARARGEATGDEGLRVSLRDAVLAARGYIREKGGDTTAFVYDSPLVGLDRASLRRTNVNADSVLAVFARAARLVPGVARVDHLSAVRRANFDRDPIARRWAHQIPQTAPVDLAVTLTPYSTWGTAIATHGSPHDYDAAVPIIFFGPWVKPGRYTTFARTVDIGVTLAAIARVKPTEKVDGIVLRNAVK